MTNDRIEITPARNDDWGIPVVSIRESWRTATLHGVSVQVPVALAERIERLERKAALADWLAAQYKVVHHEDMTEFNGTYDEIVTTDEWEDWEDLLYEYHPRYDAIDAEVKGR